MKYFGDFKSINKLDYHVELLVSDGALSSEREVTLGGDPFTTSMDGGDKTIYKPIKYRSATVNIITGNYYFNLYNQTATNVGVILKLGDTVVFKGYVTPNIYDQGFKYDREEISIECTDCLSVLKNINYLPPKRGIKNLRSILEYIFRQLPEPNTNSLNTPWLKYFYFPECFIVNNSVYALEEIYVSDYVFSDNKKEGEKDADACWKCDKVLESICQLFGVTCIQWGESVYFIDYDYIKNKSDFPHYTCYGIKESTKEQNVERVWGSKIINGDSYSGEGDPQLSLDKVYNKVTVKTKLRTYNSILPDFFDGAVNVTTRDTVLEDRSSPELGMYGISVESDINPKDGVNRNMICLIDQIYNDQKKKYGAKNAVFARYFTNPNIKTYRYSTVTTGQSITPSSSMNYVNSKFYRGAYLAKMMVKKLDKYDKIDTLWIDWKKWTVYVRRNSFDQMMAMNDINTVELSDYICLFNPVNDGKHIDNGTTPYQYPFLETVTPELTSFFGGKNTYLIISGTVKWHYKDDEPYPTPEGEYDPREGRRETSTANNLYLPCKFQWGNKYWNGSEWTTTNTGFKLYYVRPELTGSLRADGMICKDFDIPSTVTWRIGTSEQGYPIPVPEGELLSGTPKFTIYRPWDPKYNKSDGNKYMPNRMFLKNFKIKSVIGDPTYSKDTNTDTYYTNIINESFVDELKDITFDISTYDGKTPAYNTIAYKTTSGYNYIDKVIHSGLLRGESNWQGTDPDAPDSSNGLRFEEHFIYRIVHQYSTPNKVLEVSLKDFIAPWTIVKDKTLNDCIFIVDSIDESYKYNSQTIK